MPITALSKETIRILGSSQVLTTPVSLIKELIDNGLDARATAIEVSISGNTLDKIEVRDNGHGIDVQDFGELGKRGHTSKLRAFEELRQLGGVSLGFRGEALGSAVELGEVSILTRTDGNVVASLLKLKAPDGVCSQTKTSGPVGTTVCVRNFLARLPVRKQTALKETAKTLAGIKELLKSYALARPHVKLSLKVLKSGKGNWAFSPRPHDGIKEVVSQVIGRELASQCVEITRASFRSLLDKDAANSQETTATNNERDTAFEIEAFLPNTDADVTKISSSRKYVSVDARPVSCKRGTLKKIITIYKEHIRASLPSSSSDKLKDPFIRLNIVCPSGSYDPNVEPAKDDVLFENESSLLSLARVLFEGLYGPLKANTTTGRKEATKQNRGFDLLMARTPAPPKEVLPTSCDTLPSRSHSEIYQVQEHTELGIAPGIFQTVPHPLKDLPSQSLEADIQDVPAGMSSEKGKRKWGVNMAKNFKGVEDQDPDLAAFVTRFSVIENESDIETSGDKASLNPWTIAKLIAPVQKRATAVAKIAPATARQSQDLATPRQSSEPPRSLPESVDASGEARLSSSTNLESEVRNSYAAWVARHEKAIGAPPTPNDVQYRSLSLPLQDEEDMQRPRTTVTGHRSRARADFVVARDLPLGDPWTPPPTQPPAKRQRQSDVKKPFKAPGKSGGFVTVNDEHSFQPDEPPVHQSGYAGSNVRVARDDFLKGPLREPMTRHPVENQPHHDLQYSLDFEQRKEDASRKQRLEARGPTSRPSPHQNRYNAATTVLDAISNNIEPGKEKNTAPFKTSLPDGDPRAYLMRRQKSMSIIENQPERGVKLKRAKAMLLPLENTPAGSQLQNLAGTMSTDLYTICQLVMEVISEDEYLRSGMLGKAFDMEPSEVTAVRQWLVKTTVERRVISEGQNLELDLSGLNWQG